MNDRRTQTRHTIGEIAKILGVSQRALRYYEEAGLISPHVDSCSGYRYYTARDVCFFREYRDLRGMGFSLQAAKDFMLDADFDKKASLLEAQEAELGREIDRLRFLMDWSREQRRRYREVRGELGQLRTIICPAMVRIEYEFDRRFSASDRDKRLIKALQDASPAAFTSVRLSRHAVTDISLRGVFSRGLAFWEKDAALLPIVIEPPLVRVPERTAIRLVSRSLEVSRSAWVEDVIGYCESERLEICDDILGAYYVGRRIGEDRERYYEFWVPVRPRP